ncbi:hypothetical protein GGF46_003693 [Coemansia sp. RSA 552]|nr:hypothetical protein GGF46_003693 [Coemansia sp. RSA 552]
MERSLWQETAGTVLATLETALLGANAVSPGSQSIAASASRKHAHKANSDTMSDIEVPASPMKRRRESTSTGATERGDSAKPTSKCRRISSALSNQLARSLSMTTGLSDCARPGAIQESSGSAMDSIGMDTESSLTYPTSSSSSASSVSPWPQSSGTSLALHMDDAELEMDVSSTAPSDRMMKLPVPSRSARAREKTRASEQTTDDDEDRMLGRSQTSLDAELADVLGPRSRASSRVASGHAEPIENTFTMLLRPLSPDVGGWTDGAIDKATQQWALEQAHGSGMTPQSLIEALNQRISRLKELVPAILGSLSNGEEKQHTLGMSQSNRLHEFYSAALDMAAIGEWLYQSQFQLLPAVFSAMPSLLPQLKGVIRAARVSNDMYMLAQRSPIQFSAVLEEMGGEYEDLIYAKRALYSDVLPQDGLPWKAMGIPVDTALLMRVRQCLAATTEQCLTRVAHAYERRARSASAPSRGEMSTDGLLHVSHQVLHAAVLCTSMYGDKFPDLAPQVMFIVAESASWASNRCLTTDNKPAAGIRGKQLDSRALRLVRVCESLLKLLVYARAVLTTDMSLLDTAFHSSHADPTAAAACKTLAGSLVDLSWSLAETLAAFHADGRTSNPPASYLLFVDLVVKFARRVVDFGGSRVAQLPSIRPHLRRMQSFARSLDPFRDLV